MSEVSMATYYSPEKDRKQPATIESLRAEVSQLTVALAAEREENAKLLAANKDCILHFETMKSDLAAEREKVKWLETSTAEAWANHMREQLAAAQLENQKLRGVVEAVRLRIHFIGWPAESMVDRGDGVMAPDWRKEIQLIESVALYAAPPKLSAAVAVAIEQCANTVQESVHNAIENGYVEFDCCDLDELIEQIRALQTEDGLDALREFGLKVAELTEKITLDPHSAIVPNLMVIVDRVMKGFQDENTL